MKSIAHRSLVFITAAFLLAASPASALANMAQQQDDPYAPPPPGKGRDRPIQRSGPREEVYERAAGELNLPSGKEVKPLVLALEERGFFLSDAVTLLLIAKPQAEQLIAQGKFKKENYPQALRASSEEFAKLVEDEGAGFLTLLMRAGIKEDLRNFVTRTRMTLGLMSTRVPTTIDPEAGGRQAKAPTSTAGDRQHAVERAREDEARTARAAAAKEKALVGDSGGAGDDKGGAPPARKTAKPQEIMSKLEIKEAPEPKVPPAEKATKSKATASKAGGRVPDVTDEKSFPREVIYKNVAKELLVSPELVQKQLVRLEEEMPIREAVMLMLAADLYGSKKIQKGEYPKERRSEALQDAIDTVEKMLRGGAGWGDIGNRLDIGISGASLNKRTNSLIGQK